jgi:hypothetical protein
MAGGETLFTRSASADLSDLLKVKGGEENLFSATDIAALKQQFNSLSANFLPNLQQIPQSTLFDDTADNSEPPESPVSSIFAHEDEPTQHTIPDDEDHWSGACDISLPQKIHSWETFGIRELHSQSFDSPFVTEQDPKIFNELLQRHLNHIYSPNESGTVVDESLFREVPVCHDSANASVCRTSPLVMSLFYSNGMINFTSLNRPSRTSGLPRSHRQPLNRILLCRSSLLRITSEMCHRGTLFRRLASVADTIFGSPAKYGSIAISFARAIISLTNYWRSELQRSYNPRRQGILVLQSIFHNIDDSLFELSKLCQCVFPLRLAF